MGVTIAQTFKPSSFDSHLDRGAPDWLKLESVNCDFWRLEHFTDALYKAVEHLAELSRCPKTQHDDMVIV